MTLIPLNRINIDDIQRRYGETSPELKLAKLMNKSQQHFDNEVDLREWAALSGIGFSERFEQARSNILNMIIENKRTIPFPIPEPLPVPGIPKMGQKIRDRIVRRHASAALRAGEVQYLKRKPAHIKTAVRISMNAGKGLTGLPLVAYLKGSLSTGKIYIHDLRNNTWMRVTADMPVPRHIGRPSIQPIPGSTEPVRPAIEPIPGSMGPLQPAIEPHPDTLLIHGAQAIELLKDHPGNTAPYIYSATADPKAQAIVVALKWDPNRSAAQLEKDVTALIKSQHFGTLPATLMFTHLE
jgi:hypothetical protein